MSRFLALGTAVLTGMISGLPAAAGAKDADPAAQEVDPAQDVDPEAQALLLRSAEFLAGKQRFRFVTEVQYDVRQDSGELLEFGSRRETTVQRPSFAHVEAENRAGDRSMGRRPSRGGPATGRRDRRRRSLEPRWWPWPAWGRQPV